jgi:ribosomal protein L37E
LIESGSIADQQEREKLEHLINTKKWVAYCIRHSAITWDSDFLPDYALKKKARWSMNSKQPSRYIKARMGNDLKQKILVQNGIILEGEAIKPAPTIAECARCRFVNSLENKYCSSCGYPLSVSAYEELKAAESEEMNHVKAELDKVREEYRNVLVILDEVRTDVSKMQEQEEQHQKVLAQRREHARHIRRALEDPDPEHLSNFITQELQSNPPKHLPPWLAARLHLPAAAAPDATIDKE